MTFPFFYKGKNFHFFRAYLSAHIQQITINQKQKSTAMEQIQPLKLICCESMKGRQAPIGGVHRPVQNGALFKTPAIPNEKSRESEPSFRVRRPIIPSRTSFPGKSTKFRDGHYAMCFGDSTWGHTDADSGDHYASRSEIMEVAAKFDKQVEAIISSDEIEQASSLQSAADMLLDEIASMLRAECREQCELVERVRGSYAAVFSLLRDDSQKCRETISELEIQKSVLDENLSKVIDNATERVKETQAQCNRDIQKMQNEMDEKKEEYDNSMKRFLEQKTQLEEHIKALHKVFLDFQNDSVYITLEELKQKQIQLEKKIKNKEAEISKLKAQISILQQTIMENENNKSLLEQANDELRRKLQTSLAQKNRLERKLDMQNLENEVDQEDGDQSGSKSSRRKHSGGTVDSTPYIYVMHKLGLISDRIADVVSTAQPDSMFPDNDIQEIDKVMVSGNSSLMIKAIQNKINEVYSYAECLENVNLSALSTRRAAEHFSVLPRFLQYIKTHNKTQSKEDENEDLGFSPLALMTIRQIFNAKYLSDCWNHRMNHLIDRFPEFVISFFCKDGENLFAALSKAARLWRSIQGSELPEVKLFKNFLLEKFTVDELSFFLESRNSLLGHKIPNESDPQVITLQQRKCKEFIRTIFGAFSLSLTSIQQEIEKFCVNGFIDYAQFLLIITSFYQSERKRRRSAIRLMFQSRNLGDGELVDFESFYGLIQSLGFQGANTDVFALFREALLFGYGSLSLDSLLAAMDSLSFHFYTIEIPISTTKRNELTKLPRHQLLQHWIRFGSWFSPFRKQMPKFDSWLKTQLVHRVQKVDRLFKSSAPTHVLYSEYRQLLDFFQYALDVLARSQEVPMPAPKTERHILLLENTIDLLITFIMRDADSQVEFTESI